MRYKFIILFLILGFVSKAQVYQLMPQYGYSTYRMNFDSTIQIPTFCGVPKLGSNKINKGALAFDSCNNRFYYYNPKSQVWDTIKSADASLFVKYTDTAQMLSAYLRAVDTTNKWVNSVTKLNDSTIQVIKGATTSNITISSVSSATRLITQVWNNTGATILRGSVVYISGRHSSNLPTIALAEGNNESNSYKTFALVDGDILDNSSGFVIQAGKITGLNLPTSSYTDGDILYLSPTVPGGYTTTKPLAPNHIVKLGSVTRAHPTQGSIEIKIENGWQLDELSDVQIAAVPLDSTILQFSRVDSLWHDVNPTTAMGNRFIKPADTSAMLSPYLRAIDTTNKYVTSVFRKTASDSVFFVRGGTNNFAFRDSTGGANIYNTNGTLTGNRTVTMGSNTLDFLSTTTFPRILKNNEGQFGIYSNSGAVNNQGGTLILGDNAGLQNRTSIYGRYSGTGSGFYLGFANTNTSNVSTENMRITPSGSILMGTTTESASSIFTLESTTRGFLRPRMTTTQMNAISTPATGLSVFNTTDSSIYAYRGTVGGWQRLLPSQMISTFTLSSGSSNFSLSNRATSGSENTVFGDGAMNGTTGGAYNVLVGKSAGTSLSAGGQNNNTGIGYRALTTCGSCGGNTAIGSDALRLTNNNYNTTAVGYEAATNIGAGGAAFNSVYFGYRAGQLIASGTNLTSASNSVFIGANTRAFANTTSNEIVIGQDTYGAGSNKVTIGDNNITETYIKGTLSLGRTWTTVAPSVSASALLDMESTTKGFLPPRMTTAQRDLIATPAAGLIIYNTSTNKHQGYNGTTWNDFY